MLVNDENINDEFKSIFLTISHYFCHIIEFHVNLLRKDSFMVIFEKEIKEGMTNKNPFFKTKEVG